MKTRNLAKYTAAIVRAAILLCGVFFSLSVCAQEAYTSVADTTRIQGSDLDTVPVAKTDSVFEQIESTSDDEEEGEKEQPAYFTPKWMQFDDIRETLKTREIPDSAIALFKRDKAFWYADLAFAKKTEEPKQRRRISDHPAFQSILWVIIIGGFAAFVLLYLFNSNAGIFRKNRTIAEVEPDEEGTDVFSIAYQKEIEKAIAAGDYRLAIRLLYLQLLRRLAEKNFIQYRQDNTNLDYLLQLQSSAHYKDFFRLTRHYEFSWYGHFDVDKEKFEIIKKDFEALDHKLN